ncbi:hypothetical protein M405DRAFT_869016 [Rhizopogon salebrosus TDB-379]|nr:hypothetical protein M405DRAFT_869016 [Rhizopogon salebrosus TDB-379]
MITSTIDKERSFVPFKNDVTVLLVNNLGGLSGLELGRVVVEVRRALGKSGIQIMRLLVALLCLNIPGFFFNHHVSAPRRKRHGGSASLILSLLGDSTGWKWTFRSVPKPLSALLSLPIVACEKAWSTSVKANDFNQFDSAVERACCALIVSEPEIIRMDNILGDGDCGLMLKGVATVRQLHPMFEALRNNSISSDEVLGSVITI